MEVASYLVGKLKGRVFGKCWETSISLSPYEWKKPLEVIQEVLEFQIFQKTLCKRLIKYWTFLSIYCIISYSLSVMNQTSV